MGHVSRVQLALGPKPKRGWPSGETAYVDDMVMVDSVGLPVEEGGRLQIR